MTLTLVVADDHPIYRDGLVRSWEGSTEISVIGAAEDGNSALQMIISMRPDVAVVDLKLPGLDGLQILAAVQEAGLSTRVLILTAYVDNATVYQSFALGARAFLEKAASFAEITEAVVNVAAGGTVMSAFTQDVLAQELRSRREREETPPLTAREIDILRLAADGLASQRIATELHISIATVKTHLQHIYEKLGVADRAAAVARAIRNGVLR